MNREIAEKLIAACDQSIDALTLAEHAIGQIADADERKSLMRALAVVIADVLGTLRAPAVLQYPNLAPRGDVDGLPDPPLDEEDQELVSRLSAEQVEQIDRALLSHCTRAWRKAARVVGSVLGELQQEFPGIPDLYYAQRLAALVEAGRLEADGNLQYMRFSEVRLRDGGAHAP